MMRVWVLAAALLALNTAPAGAQTHPRRDPPPHFTIPPLHGGSSPGVPLPKIGLELPQIGLPPAQRPDLGRLHFRRPQDDGRRPGRHARRGTRSHVVAWPVYLPTYALPFVEPDPAHPEDTNVDVPAPVVAPQAVGYLVLNVEPRDAQVFVDGYYVGTVDDLTLHRHGLELEAGPHRIELRAPGHVASAMDVRITAGQPTTYALALEHTPEAAAAARAPEAPKRPTTFYLIPGCYMGNVHPTDASLPATCDPARTITIAP